MFDESVLISGRKQAEIIAWSHLLLFIQDGTSLGYYKNQSCDSKPILRTSDFSHFIYCSSLLSKRHAHGFGQNLFLRF